MSERPLPELVNVGRRADEVHAAETALRFARDGLDEAISVALTPPGQATVTQVAQWAGLSRESVYRALERVRTRQESTSARD